MKTTTVGGCSITGVVNDTKVLKPAPISGQSQTARDGGDIWAICVAFSPETGGIARSRFFATKPESGRESFKSWTDFLTLHWAPHSDIGSKDPTCRAAETRAQAELLKEQLADEWKSKHYKDGEIKEVNWP